MLSTVDGAFLIGNIDLLRMFNYRFFKNCFPLYHLLTYSLLQAVFKTVLIRNFVIATSSSELPRRNFLIKIFTSKLHIEPSHQTFTSNLHLKTSHQTFKMQIFTTLLLLLSSTLVVSTPIAKREYNTAKVLGDFVMLTRNVDHLTTNLASFVASPSVGFSTFSQHFTDFNEHISVTTADTIVVGSFNTTDSPSVAKAAAAWGSDTLNFLIKLMSDEAALTAAGQHALVAGFLDTANEATLGLFNALEEAVNEEEFVTLDVAWEELNAAFMNAISDYS